MTQGNYLPPTLCNVVTESVVCHWLMVVVPTEYGMKGLGLSIQEIFSFMLVDSFVLFRF